MASRPRCLFVLPSHTQVDTWTWAHTGNFATVRRGLAVADELLRLDDSSTAQASVMVPSAPVPLILALMRLRF